jgi:hypothetical protein
MDDMDVQQGIIDSLRHELQTTKEKMYILDKRLQEELIKMQQLCEKNGHEFVAESNGDCHKPGWYYTCKRCQYWTSIRPSTSIHYSL